MNTFAQIFAVFTILIVVCRTTSSAPIAARTSTRDLLQRQKRHAKHVMTAEFSDEADAERIDEIEAAASKLSRSRRSTAFLIQATLYYCSRSPGMCASVKSSSSDGANVEVRLRTQ